MAGFDEVVKKAFYFGVGIASYANERAGTALGELRSQGQKLAEEMVKRGEMTTDEARKFVDDLVKQAQQPNIQGTNSEDNREPRLIEIISDEEENSSPSPSESSENIDALRQQVQALQDELKKLRND
jgi:polyhydroxyalkanoate synthesis regulator phasin